MGILKTCFTCGFPQACKLRGSVIWRIWFDVVVCTLYCAGIIYINMYIFPNQLQKFTLPDNIISVLGVATGMLLVFRTDTSYERYYEGRKIWSDMTASIRSLTRAFWVMIDDQNSSRIIIEKISAVNLLVAFAYATKHYLRDEYSYDEDDLMQFAGHLPHLHTPSSNQPLQEQEELTINANPGQAWNRWRNQTEKERRESLEKKMKTLKESVARMKRKSSVKRLNPSQDDTVVGSNIPLEITFHLSNFVKSCKERGSIDNPTSRIVDNAIASLVSCLTSFERIHGTPIPMAYVVHLTQVTWLVLLMLPFHWTHLYWGAVPLMAVCSFSMLGILGIGREIEDPFGYDYNDLNLDEYCHLLHKEAMAITSQPLPKYDYWMFSRENHPLPHSPQLTAAELIKFSVDDVRHLLYMGKDYRFTGRRETCVLPDPKMSVQVELVPPPPPAPSEKSSKELNVSFERNEKNDKNDKNV